jgi:prevent-host-death family protein
MPPTTVSISELKDRLSAYLREAEAGATILVTRDGTPVGRIVPPENGDAPDDESTEPSSDEIERRMRAMEDEGLLTWSGKKPPDREPVADVKGKKTVAQMLLEDRR